MGLLTVSGNDLATDLDSGSGGNRDFAKLFEVIDSSLRRKVMAFARRPKPSLSIQSVACLGGKPLCFVVLRCTQCPDAIRSLSRTRNGGLMSQGAYR